MSNTIRASKGSLKNVIGVLCLFVFLIFYLGRSEIQSQDLLGSSYKFKAGFPLQPEIPIDPCFAGCLKNGSYNYTKYSTIDDSRNQIIHDTINTLKIENNLVGWRRCLIVGIISGLVLIWLFRFPISTRSPNSSMNPISMSITLLLSITFVVFIANYVMVSRADSMITQVNNKLEDSILQILSTPNDRNN